MRLLKRGDRLCTSFPEHGVEANSLLQGRKWRGLACKGFLLKPWLIVQLCTGCSGSIVFLSRIFIILPSLPAIGCSEFASQ